MIDHDRARELHATSLRALMEDPPDTEVLRGLVEQLRQARTLDWVTEGDLRNAARWIDAVVAAWERSER